MTCPLHLSWRSVMASIERQWAQWRISTLGTLSHQRSLSICWRQEMWNCSRVLIWWYRTQASQPLSSIGTQTDNIVNSHLGLVVQDSVQKCLLWDSSKSRWSKAYMTLHVRWQVKRSSLFLYMATMLASFHCGGTLQVLQILQLKACRWTWRSFPPYLNTSAGRWSTPQALLDLRPEMADRTSVRVGVWSRQVMGGSEGREFRKEVSEGFFLFRRVLKCSAHRERIPSRSSTLSHLG